MLRKLALTAAFSVVATASLAADLPVRGPAAAPFVAPPIFSWTGFYVGAQIGYNWGNDRTREFVTATGAFTGFNQAFSPNGVMGGIHAGYNMQSGSIVYGLEADLEASGYKGGYRLEGGNGTDAKKSWQGSLRARLGFAFDRALIYATGGVAFANIQHSYINAGLARVERFSDTRVGWTLGAGLEYAFTNNWSARAEYRYTNFGNISNPSTFAFNGFTYRHQPRDHAIRAGVSYKF